MLAARGVDATVRLQGRATVGLSQETWLLDVTVDRTTQPVVLRLPTAASGGRAIGIQRRALQACGAAGGIPVPRVLWADDGPDNPFGRAFLVMDRIDGEIPSGWEPLDPARRDALAGSAMEVLAAIHEVDLESFTGPVEHGAAERTDELYRADVVRYRKRFARFGSTPEAVEIGLDWLEAHPPPPSTPVLTHNDFRMGNLVVDGTAVIGVLDWELAAPGDRIADLVWCLVPVWGDFDIDRPRLYDLYATLTGAPIEPVSVAFFEVFSQLRLVYYTCSAVHAFRTGSSDDLRLAAMRFEVPVRSDRLLTAVEEATAR